jgi:DNA-binding HxlR family transcriptional regulator
VYAQNQQEGTILCRSIKNVPEERKNVMRHRSYDRLGCPVEACTEAIGGKWKGKILYILFTGTKRFGELRRLVPDATQRMLTLQLRELEEDGIIERKVFPVVPPKVEYSIAKRGESLKPIVDAMWQWGKEFLRTVPKDRIRPSSAAGAAVERLCDAPKAKV